MLSILFTAEKTQAEAKKLDEIAKALLELDGEMQKDVSILRKEIETATLIFNKHEKEYCLIEKSFLKAKQDLYLAHEKKEMLTEHLYTVRVFVKIRNSEFKLFSFRLFSTMKTKKQRN